MSSMLPEGAVLLENVQPPPAAPLPEHSNPAAATPSAPPSLAAKVFYTPTADITNAEASAVQPLLVLTASSSSFEAVARIKALPARIRRHFTIVEPA